MRRGLLHPARWQDRALARHAASAPAQYVFHAGRRLLEDALVFTRLPEYYVEHGPMARMGHRGDAWAPPLHARREMLHIVFKNASKCGLPPARAPGVNRRYRNCARGRRQCGAQICKRGLQPPELRLLTADDVLICVIEVVMTHNAGTRLVALQQRQPIGSKVDQELL